MQAHRHEAGHGEEQHHEHTPVIKKVKEKVRKIKEKIKKHGHDNEDEHEESHSYTTEEDYDDDEVQVDPAIHGAHPHFGAKNMVGERDENLGGQGKISLGEVMSKTSANQDPSVPKWDQSILHYPSVIEEQRGKESHDVVNMGKIEGRVEEDPAAPRVRTGTAAATTDQFQHSYRSSIERTDNSTSPNVNLEAITGRVEEDPVWGATAEHYTPTYPSPVGGRDEVGESPILTSFKAMSISEEPKSTSHQSTQRTPATVTTAPEKLQQDQPMQESGQEQKTSSSYTDKLSSTATAVKDAAISAAVGSTEYGKKIAHTVYDTVSGAGSKGGTEEGERVEGVKMGETADKGVSMKEYIVGKLSPGEEDRALSEVLSDTVHTKKAEVVGQRTEEGSGEKGVVEKIKGAVGSWMGAGGAPGNAAGAHVSRGAADMETTGESNTSKFT